MYGNSIYIKSSPELDEHMKYITYLRKLYKKNGSINTAEVNRLWDRVINRKSKIKNIIKNEI